ncbi:peroxisomal membrane protein 11C-like [Ruditapes philippinarum]|uniref:peroxisomal membrane protein 11C-like n=1 Tax=Ruditapes philippinarum TaxID=129788 RepID=UPI00295B4910|nr:peroxisomal membrane protein 11C-like [Ruditapes philippinarum]
MDTLVQLVGGYRERDKLIRLCQYVARFLAGTGQTNMGARLGIIAQEFGKCRTVLRLFDDIPMLAYTLHYGLGKKESNSGIRFLTLLGNCANQLYFPLEHVSWCAQNKIIDRPQSKWATACIVAWAVSLLTEIIKAFIRINLNRNSQKRLLKEQQLEARNESDSSEMTTNIRSQIRALKSQEREQYLAIVENCADLFNAINWLPAGYLWAGKFTSRFCGGMGAISSAIKLYRIHSAKWNVS